MSRRLVLNPCSTSATPLSRLLRVHTPYCVPLNNRNLFSMDVARTVQGASQVCASAAQDECSSSATRSGQQQASRNLVIAVDASEDSVFVFKWALRNLYRSGDLLHILHVLPEVSSSQPSGSLSYPSYDPIGEGSAVWRQAEEFIRSELVGPAQQRGVAVNVILLNPAARHHGNVARAVCSKAEELAAEPLVLATHHKNYFAEMLLGSVSKFCATHCKQPVLLVHPDHSQLSW